MATKRVHSYGTIPYRRTMAGLEFLVIHMYGSAGGTHWTFPKGRPEPGEAPEVTARRETREETGLNLAPEVLDLVHPLVSSYCFTHDGDIITKEVTYYLAPVPADATLCLQPEEVVAAVWLPAAAARARLTHENTRQLFDVALDHLVARGEREALGRE